MADAAQPIYYEPSIPFAQQRSDLRAGIGRRVGEKLDHTPGLWRLTSSVERPVQLYVHGGFCSPDECRELCALIDQGAVRSPVFDLARDAESRTSSTCFLDPRNPLVADVERRIDGLLGLDGSLGETLQGQRYAAGQEFKGHSDFFYVDEPYWAQNEPRGGQRTWTAMIYLNVPASGGSTHFAYLELAVAPALGRLLAWNNMAADGSPNPWTMHAGLPVTEGSKYILTKWYREQPFS